MCLLFLKASKTTTHNGMPTSTWAWHPGILLLLIAGSLQAQVCCGGDDSSGPPGPGVLRVCSDPNNLPFSNAKGEGFENRIAQLIGEELGERVEYTWWAQRRGFVRNTLNARDCDLVLGTAAGMEMLATTRPYYRSTYVFVTRRDRALG